MEGWILKRSLRPLEMGVLIAITAYACYAFAAFLVKATQVSFTLVVFARSLIGLLVFLPIFLKQREQLKTQRLGFHAIRSVLSLITIYCSIYGIQHLQLGDAILLEQTAPFFIPCVLFIWERQKISAANLVAIAIAFMGAGIILKPHLDLWQISSLASLAAGLLTAVCFVCMQVLVKTETPLSMLFYFLLISTLLSSGPAMGKWGEIHSLWQGGLLICTGIFFALFQLLLSQALQFTNANVIGAYTYFAAVFSLLLGLTFLGEAMTLYRLIGCLLIIGAGAFFFYAKKESRYLS